MKRYGYIRVSTKDQNIARQVEAMQEKGIPARQMYIDRQSGKDFERKGYQRLLKKLRRGDEVYIKSIDRLGRDYEEIMEQWRYLTRIRDVDMIVLDFPLLDTRNQVSGVTGKFVADLVLQILSYVAQVERENIRQRQAEGIQLARERGVRFGRPQNEFPENFEQVFRQWISKEISKREAGRRLGISHTSFTRFAGRYTNGEKKG